MKLGIVSCYFINNYGSILQSYATQEYFRRRCGECETISAEKLKPYLAAKKKEYYIRNINKPGLFLSKMPLIKLRLLQKFDYKGLGRLYKERCERFDDFRGRFVLSDNEAESLGELRAAVRYDAILIGSDQLWRPDNIFPEYYTLSWVPSHIPKFSYATSFGVSVLDGYSAARAKQFLKEFDALSVREESGKNIVKELTGRSPAVVCDPVFLLTKEEWDGIADRSRCPQQKYIFTYFLGSGRRYREFVKKLSEKTGLPVAGIINNDCYAPDGEKIDFPVSNAGPGEFAGLISGAEYICTDSFHAAAFSVIFGRDFFVFNRFKSKKHGTNSRISSLLKITGLEDRLVSDRDKVAAYAEKHIDYKCVNERMQEFINKSRRFIDEEILKGEKVSGK